MKHFEDNKQSSYCQESLLDSKYLFLYPTNMVAVTVLVFRSRQTVQMLPISSSSIFVIAINCNVLFLFIFEAKLSNYASGRKSTPNSDSFWVRQLFNVCVRFFCAPNATILLVYIPAKIKVNFI